MEVRLAKTAGFCMGVRLAMDKVLTIAEQRRGPIYTHGPLIHNPQAVEMLASKGIRDLEQCPDATCGTVLIRAHGVPREVEEELRARGFDIVDATCPHVIASQRQIERHAAKGYAIVIAGDKDHAEVEGLRSRAGERCVVVSTPEEARSVELQEPVCLLAQTTFSETLYGEIAATLRSRVPNVEVIQSICRATHLRQEEVLELAQEVEAMVIVGGLHSANTRRLAELARSTGKPTFHVETADALDAKALSQFQVVGLTAGASTPNWVTQSVLQALEDIARPVPRAQWLSWRVLAALTRSNVYSAAAAAALTYASCQLLGTEHPSPTFLLAAFCYVFAVTTLHRLALGEEGESYLPPRVAFYRRHARPLLAISLLLCVGSLASLLVMKVWSAAGLLLAAYALGVAYNVRWVPWGRMKRFHLARLKDVPGSKDIFTALAWMATCVLVPWLGEGGRFAPGVIVACVLAFVLSFVKATAIDLGDMQGDRLLGRETLPILLGERKTRFYMAAMTLTLSFALAAGTSWGWTPSLGWLLLACPAYMLAYLWWFHRHLAASDIVCALVADGALLLAGVVALGWALAGLK